MQHILISNYECILIIQRARVSQILGFNITNNEFKGTLVVIAHGLLG